MYDSDNAFVTMLLTMSLSPDRGEYAHPLNAQELRQLEDRVQRYGLGNTSHLLGIDISGLMLKLDISEEEAFRLYILLNRSVQLTYAIENLMVKHNIGVCACRCEPAFDHMTRRMADAAPPIVYTRGDLALLKQPLLAILGISGIKTTNEVRAAVEKLVTEGIRAGYTILTGCEPGVSLLAANLTAEHNGKLVIASGGDMLRRSNEAPILPLLERGRALVLSIEHPEVMFTIPHAITRNEFMLALAEAAFILNTDGRRGEIEAIRNRYCDRVYAWTGCPENRPIIARGATPISDICGMNFEAMSRLWRSGRAEQLSIFDML